MTTFLAGAVLLVAGAPPAVHSRLSWLQDVLPLPVVEISHFLGSLAGAALLFLPPAARCSRDVDLGVAPPVADGAVDGGGTD